MSSAILFAALAGAAAATWTTCLTLVISGTSTGLVILVGFLLLQEPFTWPRLLAIALIVAGLLLFQAQGA